MNLIYITSALNRAAFVFYILFALINIKNVYWLFLYSTVVLAVLSIRKIHKVMIFILILLPIAFLKDTQTAVFLLAASIIFFRLFRDYNTLMDYYFFKDFFITANKVLGAATIIHIFIYLEISSFSSIASSFLIIYITTSILLLRVLRVIEIEKDTTLTKFNLILISSILVAAISLSTPFIRNFIFRTLYMVYYYLTLSLAYIIAYLVFGAMKIFKFIFGSLKLNLNLNNIPQNQSNTNNLLNIANQNKSSLIEAIFNSPYVDLTIKVILFLVLIKIILSIIKSISNSSIEHEEYVEHKEFIKIDRAKKTRRKYDLNDEIEYVRYKYQRFLKSIRKDKIIILPSDTSLDVNNKIKGKTNFNINGIRELYIKARYGGIRVDKEIANKTFAEYKIKK